MSPPDLDFNCTIQELKHREMIDDVADVLYFNCTIQELKLTVALPQASTVAHFNCTIQELKQRIDSKRDIRDSGFQLHHTGIKTTESGGSRKTLPRFQLHHTGIKTKY